MTWQFLWTLKNQQCLTFWASSFAITEIFFFVVSQLFYCSAFSLHNFMGNYIASGSAFVTMCTLLWAFHFINQLSIFIKDYVSSSLTFIPWPRLSRELISRPSLQACKQEITFWLSILPGRIVRLARLPWKYWANLGLVTSPPARKRI